MTMLAWRCRSPVVVPSMLSLLPMLLPNVAVSRRAAMVPAGGPNATVRLHGVRRVDIPLTLVAVLHTVDRVAARSKAVPRRNEADNAFSRKGSLPTKQPVAVAPLSWLLGPPPVADADVDAKWLRDPAGEHHYRRQAAHAPEGAAAGGRLQPFPAAQRTMVM